jgi:glycerate kinase
MNDRGVGGMKIVIAPDSFKGSLTAEQAALSIERGIRRVIQGCTIDKIPIADGGEGTVEAMVSATGGRKFKAKVRGPLEEEVEGCFGILGDGLTAVIETACVSGLTLVPPEKRNPMLTTTYGMGQLISKALDRGCRKFIIGLGGSATVDGGTGLLSALGVEFLDKKGQPIGPGGGGLSMLSQIDPSGLDPRAKECEFLVACDVDNPPCGVRGAAAVFGPQKGATPEMVGLLEEGLKNYGEIIKGTTGREVLNTPGAGAAGGLGAGLMAFLDARLEPGIDIILKAVGFEDRIKDADLILTGEGSIDRQTLHGKAPMGVALVAGKHNVPVVAVAGTVKGNITPLYSHGFAAVVGICSGPMTVEQAMKNADVLLTDTAERIMRLIELEI